MLHRLQLRFRVLPRSTRFLVDCYAAIVGACAEEDHLDSDIIPFWKLLVANSISQFLRETYRYLLE